MARRRTNGPKKPRDWHLWNEVARTVSPLPDKRIIFPPTPPPGPDGKSSGNGLKGTNPRNTGFDESNPSHAASRFYSPPWSPGNQRGSTGPAPERIFDDEFSRPSIEPHMHRRVRRGRVPIDADIDLHGMRQHEAHAALTRFILARAARGDRTLLVITGKGIKKTGYGALAERGVLRHMLPRWLSQADLKPFVAGWEVSARHHGGEGAFYVRLKPFRP